MARKTEAELVELAREAIPLGMRKQMYSVRGRLGRNARKRLSLYVHCPTYLQDPAVAAANHGIGVVETAVRWEPGLAAGPTSARIAVVDYNGDTGILTDPVAWDPKQHAFVDAAGEPIRDDDGTPQFRQLSSWATVQSIIEYYEHPMALGRPVPWAFAGHRLIVVPHAGSGANAYYDRHSKSLQFYVYGDQEAPKYTCLSRDIVAHETGHAVLDGIRPYYLEHSSAQTAAFHEFVADLTAVLTALRDNKLRGAVVERVGADLSRDKLVSGIGDEIGEHIHGKKAPLRSALEHLSMGDLRPDLSPHRCSQVMTNAMFEILCAVAQEEVGKVQRNGKETSPAQALWIATEKFGRMALQALDLCPPADVQFLDYARAVLRNDVLVNPETSESYREIILKVFHQRGLCDGECSIEQYVDGKCALSFDVGDHLPDPGVSHDIDQIAGSRTGAYYFLDDNRNELRIPAHADIEICDLYTNRKMGRAGLRRPREVVLLYLWRERLELDGQRFGRLQGECVDLLCGGTLVFDHLGNIRSWMRKPGTEWKAAGRKSEKRQRLEEEELRLGEIRRDDLLTHVAQQEAGGKLSLLDGETQLGLCPPVVARRGQHGALCLERVPHLRNLDDDDLDGETPWTISF